MTADRGSAVIETQRLSLAPLDVVEARAVATGHRAGRAWHAEFPRPDDRDAATMVLRHPDPAFGCRLVVERASGLAVGNVGFFGPPDETGTLVVGYGLVPSARGSGYATEALRGLVAWAFTHPAVRAVVADPQPANVASHRVLEKAGFTHTHDTDDARWYALRRGAGSLGWGS